MAGDWLSDVKIPLVQIIILINTFNTAKAEANDYFGFH